MSDNYTANGTITAVTAAPGDTALALFASRKAKNFGMACQIRATAYWRIEPTRKRKTGIGGQLVAAVLWGKH